MSMQSFSQVNDHEGDVKKVDGWVLSGLRNGTDPELSLRHMKGITNDNKQQKSSNDGAVMTSQKPVFKKGERWRKWIEEGKICR